MNNYLIIHAERWTAKFLMIRLLEYNIDVLKLHFDVPAHLKIDD